MECLWRLFRYRQPDGYCTKPNPPVFYLHFIADYGFPYYYLYGTGFLEKHAKVYDVGEEKSVVLSVKTASFPPIAIGRMFACCYNQSKV